MKAHQSLRVLAVVRTLEVREALTGAMPAANGIRLDIRLGALKEIGPRTIYDEQPDVLLVDIDIDDPEDMGLLGRITHDQAGRHTPILATSSKMSPAAMRRLLRDGVADFIPQPLMKADLLDALEVATGRLREARAPEAPEPGGRIVTFLKATGGVGATTLAAHGALSLLRPKRKVTHKVALVDLDLQFGSIGLYLDLAARAGLGDILRSPSRLDAELLQGAMAEHQSGLKVLAAPTAPVPLEALSGEVIVQLLDLARQEFDYTIIDLPQALTTWTHALLSRADLIVVVTQLSVPAIRQSRRLLELLNEEGLYTVPVLTVLNRYRFTMFGQSPRLGQAEQALGRKFDHVLPNDYPLVSAALNQGVPIHEVKQRSKLGKSIKAMMEASVMRLEKRPPARPMA